MTDFDGFTEIANILHEQLSRSGIAPTYEAEYRKIIGFVLNSQKLEMSINAVDDFLFTLLAAYPEPSRTKALWIFSLLDDRQHNKITAKVHLPLFCKACQQYYDFKEETLQYVCSCCGEFKQARSEDYWLVQKNTR